MDETRKDKLESTTSGQKCRTLSAPVPKPRPVPRPRNQAKAATISENGKPVLTQVTATKPLVPPKPRSQLPSAPSKIAYNLTDNTSTDNNENINRKNPVAFKPLPVTESQKESIKSKGVPTMAENVDSISNGPEYVEGSCEAEIAEDQRYEPLRCRSERTSSSSDDAYEDIDGPQTRNEKPAPALRTQRPSPPPPRKFNAASEKSSPPLPHRKISAPSRTPPPVGNKPSDSPPLPRKPSIKVQEKSVDPSIDSSRNAVSDRRTLELNAGDGKPKSVPPKKPLPSLPKVVRVPAAEAPLSSKPPIAAKPPSPKQEPPQTSVAALAQKLSGMPVFPFRDGDVSKGGTSLLVPSSQSPPKASPLSSLRPSPRGLPSSPLGGREDPCNVASSPKSSEPAKPKLLPKPGVGTTDRSFRHVPQTQPGRDSVKQPPARPSPPSVEALSRVRSRTVDGLEDKESQQTESTPAVGNKGFVRKSSHPEERKKRLGSRLKSLRPGPPTTSPPRRAPPLPPGAPHVQEKLTSLRAPPVPVGPRPRPFSAYNELPKAHAVSKSVSVGDLPRIMTAEEQSEYSYAYEHTFLGPSPPGRVPLAKKLSSVSVDESDNSYAAPEQSIVSELMESIHRKQETGDYEEADEHTVAGFMDSLNKKQTLSGLRAVGSLSSDEADSEYSSDDHEYLEPPVEADEDSHDEDDDASSERSFSSESSGDYCVPTQSFSPPEPPPKNGSFSLAEGIYMEPFQKSSDEVFSSDDDKDSMSGEPLYQVYNARTLERERNLSRRRLSSDLSLNDETLFEELTQGTLRNMRMLWCELPEVKASGILDIVKSEERKRQEAMFEVITSEASYLKSLNILVSHFLNAEELSSGSSLCTLERGQSHVLFSNISSIKAVSESFLQALRARQKEAVVISSISDIIEEHATKFFEVYVKYCSNQIYQDRALKNLRKNPRFIEAITKLESTKKTQGLTLQSFLVLPMQRITRLPLLVNAICHRCQPGSDEFHATDRALAAINKIVNDCNEGARKMERMEEMCLLQTQIEFKTKPLALATSSRYLLRRGELMYVVEDSKSPLKRGKPKLKPLYMFLFHDLLVLTKKKNENRFQTIDYATRNMTTMEEPTDAEFNIEHMISLVLLENSYGKTKEYLLAGNSETDKTRWMEAFKPPATVEEGETVYESWDCPQVNAIHNYTAQQPDELSLFEGDVINVLKKLRDGWYHGERLCDGSQGWFPANHTEEILNEHVRARNLRQRYRLLAASKHLIGGTMRW